MNSNIIVDIHGRAHAAIQKFWSLHALDLNAALDINVKTGELMTRYTISNNDERDEGLGTPGQLISSDWARIAECNDGDVYQSRISPRLYCPFIVRP